MKSLKEEIIIANLESQLKIEKAAYNSISTHYPNDTTQKTLIQMSKGRVEEIKRQLNDLDKKEI